MGVSRTSAAGSESWSVSTSIHDPADPPAQICSAQPDRMAVMVRNDAASLGTVWVTPNQQAKGGIPLAPGDSFSLKTSAVVYAYVTGDTATVHTISEYGVPC